MADKKYPVGSRVLCLLDERDPPVPAKVLRHGRDTEGTYTEVELSGGIRAKVHRSTLTDAKVK